MLVPVKTISHPECGWRKSDALARNDGAGKNCYVSWPDFVESLAGEPE